MDKQEIYNTVKNHLLAQGKRAIVMVEHRLGSQPSCRYRTPEGDRCAVGALIKDEHYNPVIEGTSAGTLIDVRRGWTSPNCSKLLEALEASIGELDDDKCLLIAELQAVHDRSPVESWERHLLAVAKQFELEP